MKTLHVLRALAVVTTVPAFIACATTRHIDPTSTASGSVLPPTMYEAMPLDASERDMLHRMTDPNILGHMAMGDSVEVVMAQFAERRTKKDDILDFARMLDIDHNTDIQADRGLAQTTGVGIHTLATELKSSHMGRMVDSVGPQISEMTFDRNFVLAQIQMHEHMLAELQTLQDVARNAAIRDHIVAVIPVMQRHLDRAKDLARKYDYASRKALGR